MIQVSDLNNINRACVFIRHGEKDLNNFTLSNSGKRDIYKFGHLLNKLYRRIIIYSSPEDRCVQTAMIISSIIQRPYTEINISDVLGRPGIHVKDPIGYANLMNFMRCRDIFIEWKNGLHDNIINTKEFMKSTMLNFFFKTSICNGITLYISQSGTIAFTGYSLGITDYCSNDEDWVNYLDGYILSLSYECHNI